MKSDNMYEKLNLMLYEDVIIITGVGTLNINEWESIIAFNLAIFNYVMFVCGLC